MDGFTVYVVTIGMGTKVPDVATYREKRDEGGVILKGTMWRYYVREESRHAYIKAAAERLYHSHA